MRRSSVEIGLPQTSAARVKSADRGALYQVERYHPDSQSALLQLQLHHWSPDLAWNEDYFRWKYRENPCTGDPCVSLVFKNDELVGTRGSYGTRWRVGGDEVVIPCAGDFVIAPTHRGRGLFRHIMAGLEHDLADRGCSHVLNMSAGPATYLQSLRDGWRSIGEYAMWQLGKGRSPAASLAEGPVDLRGVGLFDRVDARREDASVQSHGRVVIDEMPRPREMARLETAGRTNQRVRQVRDERYWAWRFGNPLSDFRFLYCGDSELEGYAVLQVSLNRESAGYVLLEWEAADLKVKRELGVAVRRACRGTPLHVWSATRTPAELEILTDVGFRPSRDAYRNSRYKPGPLIKTLPARARTTDCPLSDSTLGAWSLSMGDSDDY